MKAPQIKQLLHSLILNFNFFSLILHGHPGIGKSSSVEQFVHELAEKENLPVFTFDDVYRVIKIPHDSVLYVYLNVNAMLPIDLSGIPEKVKYGETVVSEYIPMKVWEICRDVKYCIVFIDEYNTTENPDMQAVVTRIIDGVAGIVDLRKKKDGATLVIAAGNPPSSNAIATEPPAPVVGGKALVINVEPPTLYEFARYMYQKHGNGFDPRVVAFLFNNPQLFSQVPSAPRQSIPYPTPRGWEKVAVLLRKLDINDEVIIKELVSGLVGDASAEALLAFMKTVAPTVDDILNTSDRDEAIVKTVTAAAMRVLCKCKDAEKLQKVFEKVGEEATAVALYLSAPVCSDEEIAKLWSVCDNKDITLIRGKLAEVSVTASNEKELVEKILEEAELI